MSQMIEMKSSQQISAYDSNNCNHADDDNFFFYNESNEEIPSADDYSARLGLRSIHECQSQAVSKSPPSTCDNLPGEIISRDQHLELKPSDEACDNDDFFFYEQTIIANASTDRRLTSRVNKTSSSSSLPKYCTNESLGLDIESSSLKRCKSQSILKSSSIYNNSSSDILCDSPAPIKPSTSFSTLEIREYPITLGDNPGGAHGPPISLDWKHNKRLTRVIALEDYEEKRSQRRSRQEMHMAGDIRMWRLRENGNSIKEISKASSAADSVRRQRRKSIQSQYSPISRFKERVGHLVSSLKNQDKDV